MGEAVFEKFYYQCCRTASLHASMVAARNRLPRVYVEDLRQEGLLELWRKAPRFDPQRGAWKTFSDRVVANRMASLARGMRSQSAGQFREEPIETVLTSAIHSPDRDLSVDVSRVLSGVSRFDRTVAMNLVEHSPSETSRKLSVSRASVYRSIARLRKALAAVRVSTATRRRS